MKKQELIDHETEQLKIFIQKLEDIDPRIFELCETHRGWNGALTIHKKCNSYPDFLVTHKEFRKTLGKHKLEDYWTPFANQLCVRYRFKDSLIRFDISTEDVKDSLGKVSNGKCKIVTVTSEEIQCNL